jgi:Zn-dependent peptidase ImmA (M78 family)
MKTIDEISRLVENRRNTIPVDVKSLCSDLGLKLTEIHMDDKLSGILKRLTKDTFAIQINSRHPETRKRFTIAHEIGHFVLHRHLLGIGSEIADNLVYRGKKGIESNAITQEHETEANKFAANLLMPIESIIKYHDLGVNTVEEMAKKFMVSRGAMEIRAGRILNSEVNQTF